MLSDGLGEGLVDRGVVIDIECDRMDWKLFRRGYFADFRAAIQISHRRGDGMPCSREGHGGREPNAAARSGDQSQSHVACPFRFGPS